MERVLGDLAACGYDAEWQSIRASDVGAPHRRERIWIVAYMADATRRGQPMLREPSGGGGLFEQSGEDVADAQEFGRTRRQLEESRTTRGGPQLTRNDWWTVEPDVGRVAHGVPSRV